MNVMHSHKDQSFKLGGRRVRVGEASEEETSKMKDAARGIRAHGTGKGYHCGVVSLRGRKHGAGRGVENGVSSTSHDSSPRGRRGRRALSRRVASDLKEK